MKLLNACLKVRSEVSRSPLVLNYDFLVAKKAFHFWGANCIVDTEKVDTFNKE